MTILVIGDVMLDRYWSGDVNRLSQEAPIPVVKMAKEAHRLGAAANVAANCAAMGAKTLLLGIVGVDESAENMRRLIDQAGFAALLVEDPSICTTQKLRIIGKGQQIVRIDFEKGPTESLGEIPLQYINNFDTIVFSDYGKGALRDVAKLIAAAKAAGKRALVDPKGHDYGRYAGADVLKPNRDELRDMSGGWGTSEQLASKARAIRREADVGALVVTMAADGMIVYDDNGSTHIQSQAREVYDVTGAGDTVMAAMAVMLDEGKSLREAAEIANQAAGIAVGKFGTAIVSRHELEEAMNG